MFCVRCLPACGGVNCLLFVVCCFLFVVCCLLFVVCCLLFWVSGSGFPAAEPVEAPGSVFRVPCFRPLSLSKRRVLVFWFAYLKKHYISSGFTIAFNSRHHEP
jgi:hypothetical protein